MRTVSVVQSVDRDDNGNTRELFGLKLWSGNKAFGIVVEGIPDPDKALAMFETLHEKFNEET